MKIWITKYALTSGIEMIDSERMASFGINDGILSFCRYSWSAPEIYNKQHWYTNEDSAKTKAENMRKNKIISLRNQITKLEAIKFE